ncbi:hypothetical protein Q9Q94_07125 [Uliginosibacterium sp. 31-16]|uniref:hypothetical protein n=1 Tax=Uliginosibacterium sp. 31-16 TaxID=3068315 RepID=UPI00273F3A4C|nr:hypothetical protein [Uliginosibacterium sp. 31-16]MDP5239295.1 hypothetical protein [Uliginosibacterium sp. 31-16]
MGGNIGSFLGLVLSILPMFLVYATGICIAAVRWQQHPRVSGLCLAGFGCLILGLLISVGLNIWMVDAVAEAGFRPQISLVIGLVTAIRFACDATGWGFLMFALFSRRKEA